MNFLPFVSFRFISHAAYSIFRDVQSLGAFPFAFIFSLREKLQIIFPFGQIFLQQSQAVILFDYVSFRSVRKTSGFASRGGRKGRELPPTNFALPLIPATEYFLSIHAFIYVEFVRC